MKKFICILLVFLVLGSAASASDSAIKEHMHSNYAKALALSGMKSFNGYCAACVAYQGMAHGIHTQYISGNGNQAFERYSSITRTGGGWLTKSYGASEYSIKQVLTMQNTDGYSGSYYPIVLGFNKGTASAAGQRYGHAMMIYAVRAGMVYFTDSTEPVLEDNIYSMSIDDFCTRYSDKADTPEEEFVYDGAIVFYKNAPDGASVTTKSEQYTLWESATFDFAASGATAYSLGVDKDGVRVMTLHTSSPSYTAQFGEAGTYTAYVTACNAFGFTDSKAITFRVGSSPENAFITSSKQSIGIGEAVTISYGADFATSYAIGITHPDGSFEAIQTTDSSIDYTFESAGTYTIFATCCNSVGYVDTQVININVG